MVDFAITNTNNLERVASTVVKEIIGEVSTNERGAITYIEDGDFIFLGRTTEDALLGTPILMIDEDFPSGATIDFGYVTYDDKGPIGINPIHTSVPICSDDITTAAKMVRLPWSSKQVNPDGSEYTGEDGLLWGGTAIGCVYHGPSAITGRIKIVIPSTGFGYASEGTYLKRGA